MNESNGGELKPGQRLERIETELRDLTKMLRGEITALHARVTKHRENNAEQVKELATHIVSQFDSRLISLETKDKVDDAAAEATEAAKKEARSNKRWVIGSAITLGGLLITALGLLLAILQRGT